MVTFVVDIDEDVLSDLLASEKVSDEEELPDYEIFGMAMDDAIAEFCASVLAKEIEEKNGICNIRSCTFRNLDQGDYKFSKKLVRNLCMALINSKIKERKNDYTGSNLSNI